MALHSLLNCIITNCMSSTQCFVNISFFQILFYVMGPNSSVKVSLKFLLHCHFVGLYFRHSALDLSHFSGNPKYGLHMMSNFVGNNISHCKITSFCAETCF